MVSEDLEYIYIYSVGAVCFAIYVFTLILLRRAAWIFFKNSFSVCSTDKVMCVWNDSME